MVVPLAVRSVIAIAGALLVLTAWVSVIGTLIVPRPAGGWLTRWVDRIINAAFRTVTSGIADHKRRDRVLAAQAAAILLAQLVAWLGIFFVGYALLLWPFVNTGLGSAFSMASPEVFGPNAAVGNAEKVLADLAAFTALVAVTLQIAYLPTLYAEFNRRENEVSLLNARAGVPSWGPELLARTHYALGSGRPPSTPCPTFTHSGSAGPPTWRKATPPTCRWCGSAPPGRCRRGSISLLAVLDSAALYLALSPRSAPVVPARLCLRGGFECLTQVARAMDIDVPEEVDPAMRDQPQLRRVPRRGRPDAQGPLPDRARARRRLAGLRRLAGQLRAGRLRGGRRRRCRPGDVVGSATAPGCCYRPHPPGDRTAARAIGHHRRCGAAHRAAHRQTAGGPMVSATGDSWPVRACTPIRRRGRRPVRGRVAFAPTDQRHLLPPERRRGPIGPGRPQPHAAVR